jgi:cytochrome P450
MTETNTRCPYHSDPSTCIGTDFNPLSSPQLDNPYPFYAMARKQEPVFFSSLLQAWVVTRYEDVKTILRDNKNFSVSYLERLTSTTAPELLSVLNQGIANADFIIVSDPPDHTRARQLLTKAFSARRVASLEPTIRYIATNLLEQLLPLGQADFVAQFAAPFPLSVILHLLGLPEHDLPQVRTWAEDSIMLLASFLAPEQQLSCAKSYLAFQQYMLTFMEQRRLAPQDDLTSDLLAAAAQEQFQLSPTELLGILLILVSAGVNTTADILGSCVYHLLKQSQYWTMLQQEPDRLPTIIEEMLRLDGPTPGTFRLTTQAVEVANVVLPKDAMVYLVLGSANHDEAIFDTSEVFDPSRSNLSEHLAFGYGIHFCIGAPLARLELRVGLECLLSQLPSLRLVSDEPLQYQPSVLLRGSRHMLIQWDKPS